MSYDFLKNSIKSLPSGKWSGDNGSLWFLFNWFILLLLLNDNACDTGSGCYNIGLLRLLVLSINGGLLRLLLLLPSVNPVYILELLYCLICCSFIFYAIPCFRRCAFYKC